MIVLCRNADQVHDMMDDIHEQQELAQEISEAISHPVGFNNDVDEVCICHYLSCFNVCLCQLSICNLSNSENQTLSLRNVVAVIIDKRFTKIANFNRECQHDITQ